VQQNRGKGFGDGSLSLRSRGKTPVELWKPGVKLKGVGPLFCFFWLTIQLLHLNILALVEIWHNGAARSLPDATHSVTWSVFLSVVCRIFCHIRALMLFDLDAIFALHNAHYIRLSPMTHK